jgi:hypothetical protein
MNILVVEPRNPGEGLPGRGNHAAEVPPVIAIGLAFLALFSLLSIVLGNEDPRQADPRDDVRLWMRFASR